MTHDLKVTLAEKKKRYILSRLAHCGERRLETLRPVRRPRGLKREKLKVFVWRPTQCWKDVRKVAVTRT